MKIQKTALCIIAAICLLALMPPLSAEETTGQSRTVIYQTSFSTAPNWITNNPSNDYWDERQGTYHFSLEPSTGNYAYIPVEYDRGPFTLEYDVTMEHIDEGATFRLGFSGTEMDPSKGPMVLTQFTNAKFGQIMWLRLVTFSNKLVQINSQKGDELSSGTAAYTGPTAKYELNRTYHVTVTYDAENRLLSMKVNDKVTGKDIWGYFVNTGDDLHGMNRIFIGSKGDYGMMGIYAQGYIDNVRLTAPASGSAVATAVATEAPTPIPTLTKRPTPLPSVSSSPLPPTETPQSPPSAVLPFLAVGIAALSLGLLHTRKP